LALSPQVPGGQKSSSINNADIDGCGIFLVNHNGDTENTEVGDDNNEDDASMVENINFSDDEDL
jgi:hypothetical protein